MEPFKPRAAHGPEFHIQKRWIAFLEAKGWLVERMSMGAFMSGIPDIYIAHPKHGTRWIDIKVYGKYSFTKAQKIKWPEWESFNIPIWIIGAYSPEECTKEFMIGEYPKLFGSPNWRDFWKDSWDKAPTVDDLLDEVDDEAHPCQSNDVVVKESLDSDGEKKENVIPILQEIKLPETGLGEMLNNKGGQSRLTRKEQERNESVDAFRKPPNEPD